MPKQPMSPWVRGLIGSVLAGLASVAGAGEQPKAGHAAPAAHAAAPTAHATAPAGHAGPAGAGHTGPAAHVEGPGHAGHEGHEEHGMAGHEHHEFHEHDVHRFSHEELGRWRGGRWNNTCFNGRCGWWWFAGGQWYFYDRPVYPYPLAVSTIGFVEPVVAVPVQPMVQVMPAPMPAPTAPLPPPPKFLYYCDNPPGYYPAVANCNTDFRQVPAQR